MEKKTVLFPIFRFVVPADFEAWMENMAQEGWQIDHIHQFHSFAMPFQKKEPRQYRYIFDFNAFPNLDYMDTYRDFGWEYVGKMASCIIWRKESETGFRPESFSDQESLMRRNKRVILGVSAAFFMMIAAIMIIFAAIGLCLLQGKLENVLSLGLEAMFLGVLASYLGWVIHKIRQSQDR